MEEYIVTIEVSSKSRTNSYATEKVIQASSPNEAVFLAASKFPKVQE